MDQAPRTVNLPDGRIGFYGSRGNYITHVESPLAKEALFEAYEAGELTRGKYGQFLKLVQTIEQRKRAIDQMEFFHTSRQYESLLEEQSRSIQSALKALKSLESLYKAA
jgi:hypothetical protein